MAKGDPLLSEDLCHYMRVASDEAIMASIDTNPKRDRLFFGRICRNLENLRDCWRKHEPKTQRINCQSFVLSVYFTKDPKTLKPFLYCGLNNGDLQMWGISGQTHSKIRQMEVHDKGVKVSKHRIKSSLSSSNCQNYSFSNIQFLSSVFRC